jgi:4-hydroxy-3-methylbut-2-enyl diphosphate reductase
VACNVFDATCPLVTKVHLEVSRLHKQGYEIVMIGHKGHPEVEGTMGQATGPMYLVENIDDVAQLRVGAGNAAPLAYVTQTTLSVDDAQVVVVALRPGSPKSSGRRRMTSATPRKTGRMPSRPWAARWTW